VLRRQARFDAIPRIVSSVREKYQQDSAPPVGPLPFIDMQPWDSTRDRSHSDRPANVVFR
jgi:hypothetical protein